MGKEVWSINGSTMHTEYVDMYVVILRIRKKEDKQGRGEVCIIREDRQGGGAGSLSGRTRLGHKSGKHKRG
jgi:hypothetical protein